MDEQPPKTPTVNVPVCVGGTGVKWYAEGEPMPATRDEWFRQSVGRVEMATLTQEEYESARAAGGDVLRELCLCRVAESGKAS